MENGNKMRVCPRCKRKYSDYPATSRRDNTIQICPDCGLKEAMNDSGINLEKQKEILDAVHRYSGKCEIGKEKEGEEEDEK